MSSKLSANDHDIMRACGYIKDDKYIASYYGISAQKVKRLREKGLARLPKRNASQNSEIDLSSNSKNIELTNRKMAKIGSDNLLKALNKFYENRKWSLVNASKP